MAQKLKLNTTAGKHKVRLHVGVLLLIIALSLVVGFAVSNQGLITGKTPANCVPAKDLQYFLDQANEFRGMYEKCEKDLWSLTLVCKMTAQEANAKLAANATN